MFARYKELWYGASMGFSMWILDAMMHASMQGQLSWGAVIHDLLDNNITQIFFRCLFVIVSMAFGFALWTSNKHKGQVNDLRNTINTFHGKIANPLMLILGYARLLSLKEGWPVSRQEVELLHEIQLNAEKINDVINCLPPPGTPLMGVEVASLLASREADYREQK